MAGLFKKSDVKIAFVGAAAVTGIYAFLSQPVEAVQAVGSLILGGTDTCVFKAKENIQGQTVYRNSCDAPVNAMVCTRGHDKFENAIVTKTADATVAQKGGKVTGAWSCAIGRYEANEVFATVSRSKNDEKGSAGVTIESCIAPLSPSYAYVIFPVCKERPESTNSSVLIPALRPYSPSR